MTALPSSPPPPPTFSWKRQNPPQSPELDWQMYRYTPSLAGAIVSLLIFLLMALVHLTQFLTSRNRIIIFIVIGAFCEVGGYGARISSHYNNQAWGPYITQGVLTLIGPLWFAATIYMMLGRTIVLAGDDGHVSFLKPRWYTRVFVGADVGTLIVQGLGSSIMGTMQLDLAIAGEKIVIAGLALQVFTFVVFLVAALDFQRRMARRERSTTLAAASASTTKGHLPVWRKTLYILYSVSALVLFRCTFRLVEYSMGNAAYLMKHEWTLYCFDAVPMFLVLVLLAVLRPSRYVEQTLGKARMESNGETGLVEGK